MTREQFLENKISIIHQAIVDQQCDLLLPEEEWKDISEISKIPHPYHHTPEPYEPTEREIDLFDEWADSHKLVGDDTRHIERMKDPDYRNGLKNEWYG